MLKVYVAGAMTKGDVAANVRAAVLAADRLHALGCAPFVPHLTFFADAIAPRPYEDWIAYDLVWVAACDCLLRLPGHSPGADREVAFALANGIPVFRGLAEFEAHLAAQVG
jgi:hypothetical protein